MPLKEGTSGPVERSVCKRNATKSSRFKFNVGSKSFTQQYDLFYESRLKAMSKRLQKPIENNLGKIESSAWPLNCPHVCMMWLPLGLKLVMMLNCYLCIVVYYKIKKQKNYSL